jgi:thioredoxin reductase
MLARGVSQLIRVEINHMTWQSHFTLRYTGPMAGHGTIPGGLPNFLPLFPRRKGFFLEEVALKQTPLLFAIGDVRAGSTKRVAAAVGEGAAVVPEIHHVVAAESG